MSEPLVSVIGAGPAGLTAAYLLAKRGVPVVVFEADPTYVGGIARTVRYKGFGFDIGGHRFFSKSRDVENLWAELLPHDLLERRRSSRIYYRRRLFSYPLRPVEAFFKLGPLESAACLLSYLKARAFPVRAPASFEDWVSNQFGHRLFSIFFKTYTEKVWGMSCREISADWAAQRIKGLSLGAAIWSAFRRSRRRQGSVIKTLIESFRYPRLGPGMLWEACADRILSLGGEVLLDRRVVHCRHDAGSGRWQITVQDSTGHQTAVECAHVITSAPLRQLVQMLEPPLSPAAMGAGEALRYRDFVTVALILRDRGGVPDNWLYIHDPDVLVGRIQNFKSWSPDLVPDPALTCYGLEYFCSEGDDLWARSDSALVDLARTELQQLGLAKADDVVDGTVARQLQAYPVYDDTYARNVDIVRHELESRFPTLHTVGRNGMHRYNNQDHSMMTAMLSVENIVAGRRVYDTWKVNVDAEYLETQGAEATASTSASGLRSVPRRVPR